MDGYAVDRLSIATGAVSAGLSDVPLRGAERYRPLRLRFDVVNGTGAAVTLTPQLEYSQSGGGAGFRTVPVGAWVPGEAFYATANPATGVTLPAGSATEIVFDLRATVDAGWQAAYLFRIRDADTPIEVTRPAVIEMGLKPPIALSIGQVPGDPVVVAAIRYTLVGSDVATSRIAVARAASEASAEASPHGGYTLVTDACAACHSSHASPLRSLIQGEPNAAAICFSCHGAAGPASDIEQQFDAPSLPPNDPAAAAWFSHPATAPSNHTSDADNEFEGKLERHAQCADCHDPHQASSGLATLTAAGWTRSGALEGVAGTALVAGASGAPPTYARTEAVTLEYELCLKCHSGSTQLLPADPAHPSRWALDKGREIDPGSASYHPIAAPGTNATTAMANSLAGSSPNKLWTYPVDATIRCASCHGDPAKATPADPPDAADRLAVHASPNRGLLMAPYRDRTLPASGAAYEPSDFALCYQCHGESPYVDASGDANEQTSFNFHGLHVSDLAYSGSGGTAIDVAGAGEGNAVCAECHFRIHGTALALNPGDRDNARLVNFAPDVEPLDGTLRWTQSGSGGTCTLVCHGVSHAATPYGP